MKITEEQIQENLKAVKEGRELTIPLAVLDGGFKRRYEKEVGGFNVTRIPHEGYKKQHFKYPCDKCGKKFERTSNKNYLCPDCHPQRYNGKIKNLHKYEFWNKIKSKGVCKRCERLFHQRVKGLCLSCYNNYRREFEENETI